MTDDISSGFYCTGRGSMVNICIIRSFGGIQHEAISFKFAGIWMCRVMCVGFPNRHVVIYLGMRSSSRPIGNDRAAAMHKCTVHHFFLCSRTLLDVLHWTVGWLLVTQQTVPFRDGNADRRVSVMNGVFKVGRCHLQKSLCGGQQLLVIAYAVMFLCFRNLGVGSLPPVY